MVFERGGIGLRLFALCALLLSAAALVLVGQDPEDWSNSPEAYFLTKEEKAEWKTLDSRDLRQRFIERYWLKRDPTPGTEKNEFRDLVLARIKTADARFKIEKTPGSRTARGQVFIVLGSPAHFQDDLAPKPLPDRPRQLGVGVTPVALLEGNETTSTWVYDRDRTPRILEVLHRASLEIKMVVEPSRHMDAIQNPGLFADMKELVARASIVNPDLVPGTGGGGAPTAMLPLLPHQPLAAAQRQVLDAAPAAQRSEGAFASSAVVFRDSGEAETLLWIFSARPSKRPQFHALVRGGDGGEVASISEPAEISNAFSTHAPGMVALRRVSLPPGSYSVSVALTEEGGKPLASATLPLQVPAVSKAFAASSLVLTRGPAVASSSASPVFTFGTTVLPPRADASFSTSESLWYFVEVANPTDSSKVMLEPRLRRGGAALASLQPFPAILQLIGSGRYLAGVELPLASLEPGDYVLYLSVTDGDGEGRPRVLRRADFQVAR